MQPTRVGITVFAAALIGLGILGLIHGDFALVWQPVPRWVPARELIAYACGLVSFASGLGLLWRRTAGAASTVAFVYLLLWLVLLRFPAIFMAPQVEVSWSGCGENAIALAGALVLFAILGSPGSPGERVTFADGMGGDRVTRGVSAARIVLGVALIPCGLAHLVYLKDTAAFVPVWIPGHVVWAIVTALGFFAAAAGILFSFYARLAAAMVTGMMAGFTLLTWMAGLIGAPADRMQWTGLFVSWLLTGGSWVVADTYRGIPWLAARPRRVHHALANLSTSGTASALKTRG
jgi:hypothetical protein